MKEITRFKKVKEWEEELMPAEFDALLDQYYTDPEEIISAREVLDAIVNYFDGIQSAYHMRSIISRVYGVELG